MRPSPIAPDKCPQCAQLFVSERSLDSHLRLDHVVDRNNALTVADILSRRPEEPSVVPLAMTYRKVPRRRLLLKRAQLMATQPWLVAALTCAVVLFAVSHLSMGADRLLLLWVFAGVAGAALALAAWMHARLRPQPNRVRPPQNRQRPPWQ